MGKSSHVFQRTGSLPSGQVESEGGGGRQLHTSFV